MAGTTIGTATNWFNTATAITPDQPADQVGRFHDSSS